MSKSYKCSTCNAIVTSDDINAVTIKDCCINREERRKYVGIDKTKRSDRLWYRCPKCGNNVRRFGFMEVMP